MTDYDNRKENQALFTQKGQAWVIEQLISNEVTA